MNSDRFVVTGQRNKLFWTALMIILLAFFLWQVNHLEGFRWDFDEGVYMMEARLLRIGYRLYADIFSPSPPLFIKSLSLAFALAGPSAQVARAVVVAYSTLGLLSVALIARELQGWVAGLSAAVLLSITPDFFIYSRACIGDLPAISVAALAILTSLLYRRSRWKGGVLSLNGATVPSRGWLMLSGLALSAGILLKFLAVFAVPLVALIVIETHLSPLNSSPLLYRQHGGRWRLMVMDLLWVGAFFGLPILLCLLVYEWGPIYEQVVEQQWMGRTAFKANVMANLRQMVTYLLEDRGLAALALYGALTGLILQRNKPAQQRHTVHQPQQRWPVIAWLILVVLMLLNHAPLWPHLLTPLLFPLAILGGLGVEEVGHCLKLVGQKQCPEPCPERSRRAVGGRRTREVVGALMGACALLVYGLNLPGLLRADGERLVAPQVPIDLFIPHFLQAVTHPDDFIITDEPLVAFWADRNAPPPLTDTSFVRMRTGFLTTEQLISLTEEYDPSAIVFWSSGRFAKNVPEYVDWVDERYTRVERFGERRKVYLRFRPSVVSDLSFGGELMLMGYDLELDRLESDGQLDVTLYWQDLEPVGENYEVVLKLLDGAYKVWGREDGPPVDGLLPTGTWQKGELIVDRHTIRSLPGTPPGDYCIEVALYGTFGRRWLEPDLESSALLGPVTLLSQRWSPKALDIEQHVGANLGDGIRLLGYNIESGFRPGDNIHLTLFWQCLEEMEQSYTVFTHLVDAGDHIVAQKDNPPVDGFYPTTKWEEGEIVRDQYDLTIPQDIALGEYRFKVGMYLVETGERLRAVRGDESLPEDAVTLPPLQIHR
jgi:4-amino-4-deoxy-L-arabinose transferase-like glycosyltransferase